jgi:hypothetical protein
MMQTKQLIIAVSGMLLFLVTGCAKKEVNPTEFISWVENPDNGLKKMKEMGGVKFETLYKPYEYVVLKEEGPIENKEQLATGIKELGEMQYFTFRISTNNEEDPLKYKTSSKEDYFYRVKYYSFDFQSDIQLIEGNDTLKCQLAHYERNFSIAPEVSVLLGFEKSKNEEIDKRIVYNDNIFNSGPVSISITATDIKKLPKLKI